MSYNEVIKVNSISDFHHLMGLPKPQHPLISLVDYSLVRLPDDASRISWAQGLYSISVKRALNTKFKYGQQIYDFDEGVMFFLAPGQVLSIITETNDEWSHSGWMLLVHPDYFWNTALASSINRYDFFSYAVNEALFLSEREESIIDQVVQNIKQEYHSNMDNFSQNIIISHIETLLSYSERFYQRQFITRKISNHQILHRLNSFLDRYFNDGQALKRGLPQVTLIAKELNVSVGYLTSLLKTITGRNTQQHIQDKVIDKAKEKLSTTDLTVGEIAYELGFGHSQSFNKLFRSKTNLTPQEFRILFN